MDLLSWVFALRVTTGFGVIDSTSVAIKHCGISKLAGYLADSCLVNLHAKINWTSTGLLWPTCYLPGQRVHAFKVLEHKQHPRRRASAEQRSREHSLTYVWSELTSSNLAKGLGSFRSVPLVRVDFDFVNYMKSPTVSGKYQENCTSVKS